jgi:hypothetical protein
VDQHGADRQPPLFFISYAHDSGTDDKHVQRFYQDLDHDVLMFAGRRHRTAGFCDVSFELGDRWSPSLIKNLSTAQVFIPVLSPVYFASEACGKEWTVFTSRLDRSDDLDPTASSIIPLLWVPMELPPIALPYQYREATFGAAYEKVKLRSLIRESRHGDDYKSFVQTLAERVVRLSKTVTVAEATERPGFDDVHSAFAADRPPRLLSHHTGVEKRGGNAGPPAPRNRDRPILNPFTPNEESR